MAPGPITSWQMHGEKGETVTDFIFLGSKITADRDCSHESETLAPWKKSRDRHRPRTGERRRQLAGEGPSGRLPAAPVATRRCEGCAVEEAERRRVDASPLWRWRRLLRAPWTARRGNQLFLNEISPEYSLKD